MHDFYDAVMREISEKLRNYIEVTLPKKGFNQTVTGKIKDACLRLDTTTDIPTKQIRWQHQTLMLSFIKFHSMALAV